MLDISAFLADEGSPAAAAFVDELGRVCHEVGFFHLTGHGVDSDVEEGVHTCARRFFALPEAERLAIENVRSPQFRGYTRLGQERTNGRVDLRDQIDLGLDVPTPTIGPDDPRWLRLRGPNQWPTAVPELQPTVSAWMAAMERVGRSLLRAISLALGQPADCFDHAVDPLPEILVKVIRYPAADAMPEGSDLRTEQGVGAHRDIGFLTFLHQDAVGGLQVARPGGFVDVAPVPGAYVVNLGEMLQIATHGYLKATVHRVKGPPAGVERISVAYFFNPRLEASLHPVDLPPALAALAPGGESADPATPILADYGDQMLMVRLRSHPDVAERHHADLLAAGIFGPT